jgi:integrase
LYVFGGHKGERHDWHLGASQTDLALLTAENVNWKDRAVLFSRKKTGTRVLQFFDEETAAVLRTLPSEGPLFPYLRTVRAGDRATEFKQRCTGLKIKGVSLHSYRYAWAQRARLAGMPKRFAQEALGQNSGAVHQAYADVPEVRVPSLSDYEKRRAMFAEGTLTEPLAEAVNA